MLKALFVIELAALLCGLSMVFSCTAAKGEALEDLVQGALGEPRVMAVLKYGDFAPTKNELEANCGEPANPAGTCSSGDGPGRDEISGGEREYHVGQ